MQPGADRPRIVRANATVTHDRRTEPREINLDDVTNTREFSTSAGQRQLVLDLRTGDSVVLIGDEADEFERARRGVASEARTPTALAPEQRRFLQAVFDHFHVEGQWPTYWGIGRKLVRELDVEAVATSLPPGFVNADSAWEAKYNNTAYPCSAMLFLPALRLCRGTGGELAAFLAALHLCLERQADPDLDAPEIVDADLRGPLQLDEVMARKTALLLQQEPQVLGNGGGTLGTPTWCHAISPDIARYSGVRTIDEYVARCPAPARVGVGDPRAGGGFGSWGEGSPVAAPRITINLHDAKEAVMLNEHGRQILRFLDRVYADGRLDSSVLFITLDGPASLRARTNEPGAGGTPTDFECDEQDVLELIDLGYITRGSGAMIRISAAGRQLVTRDFAAVPARPAATQTITISGGTIGNLSASAQGPTTISGSPVVQGVGDLREALGQLIAAIDGSDLPEEVRADATLETAQLRLELDKATKNSDRIRGFLTSIGATVAGSGQLVEAVGKLGEVLHGHGLI